MRRPQKTETPPPAPGTTAPATTSAPDPLAPGRETYMAARAEWNERYGSYIQQARSWRLAFFMSATVSLMSVGGVVYIGSQNPNANDQTGKQGFLAQSGSTGSDDYLNAGIQHPKSPYEVIAGTVIPATMIGGIDSDLPGEIIGQVRENVYDTATGKYLLIPQGSRLVGVYSSAVTYRSNAGARRLEPPHLSEWR